MSKIAQFRAAEEELGKQLAALEELRNDIGLKRELEFDSALRRLMADYGVDGATVAALVGVEARPAAAKATGGKRVVKGERPKTFLNPHTGERLTIKRLSHSKYRAWADQYGEVIVHTWLQD